MSKVKHLTEANYEKEVKTGVAVVDFWAEWCGPCKMVGPVLDQLSEEMVGVNIYKVNVDEEQGLASENGIRSIPTIKIFKDGKQVEQIVGALPKEVLAKKIENAIK